ncbi:hypothetical protein ADUPG1_003330, partial [Aduncisulcus paluster]
DGGVSCHESNSGASTSQKEEDIAGNFIHVKEWYKIIPEYSQQFKSIDEDSSINRNEKKEEEGEGEKKERGKNATKEGDSLEGEENGEDVELETLTVSCGIVPRIPSVCDEVKIIYVKEERPKEEEEARDEEKEDGVSVVEVEEEINEPQETQEDAKKEKKTKMPKKTSKAKS